jgi:hypothetical protein
MPSKTRKLTVLSKIGYTSVALAALGSLPASASPGSQEQTPSSTSFEKTPPAHVDLLHAFYDKVHSDAYRSQLAQTTTTT